MHYALIKNNRVENIIIADAEFIRSLPDYTAIPLDDNHQRVQIGWEYYNDFTPPPTTPNTPDDFTFEEERNPWDNLLDVDAYIQRFGTVKTALLTSDNIHVRAHLAELQFKPWVDVSDTMIKDALDLLATVMPELTEDIIANILSTNIADSEQRILRQRYYSK